MAQYHGDDVLQVRGFKVEVHNAGGQMVEDSAWETCTGGALNIEGAESLPPGHSVPYSVDELVLTGPVTRSRTWVSELINAAAAGDPFRFDLTIIEINRDRSEGRRFNYLNCFLTEYRFPALNLEDHNMLEESVTIKAERLAIS